MLKIATAGPLMAIMLVACAPPPQPSTYRPSYSAPAPQTPDPEPGVPVNLTAQQQQTVRVDTTKRLKDPESARFGKMWAARDTEGVVTVCGLVNAKNSYGGYTGMSPFIGVFPRPQPSSGFHVVKIGSSEKDQDVVLTVCRKHGVPIAAE